MLALHPLTTVDTTYAWMLYLLLTFLLVTIIAGAISGREAGGRQASPTQPATQKTAGSSEKSRIRKESGRVKRSTDSQRR